MFKDKGFLQDTNGNLSMMRLSHLICMVLSTVLAITATIGIFMDKDITIFLTTSVAMATIGTAGKSIQSHHETK